MLVSPPESLGEPDRAWKPVYWLLESSPESLGEPDRAWKLVGVGPRLMPGSQGPIVGSMRQLELRLFMVVLDMVRHEGWGVGWSSLVAIVVFFK